MSTHRIIGSEALAGRDYRGKPSRLISSPAHGSMQAFRARRYPLSVRVLKAIGQGVVLVLFFGAVVALAERFA